MVLNRQNVAHKQMRVLINWHSVGFPHRRCATTETSDEKMSFGNIFMFFYFAVGSRIYTLFHLEVITKCDQ